MRTQIVFLALFFSALISCKNDNEVALPINGKSIMGCAQKGPYLNGASVNIFELDNDFNQTGKVFSTQIFDNSGSFEIDGISLITQYVLLKVEGYYYNEVKGENENSPLILYALCDLSDESTLNVNIMTYLEKDRLDYLISQGMGFTEAKDSAQQELLRVFNMQLNSISNSEILDISQVGDENAILLAISVLLQYNLSIADFSTLLANFIIDFREDGTIEDNRIIKQLNDASYFLDLEQIRSNLTNRYQDLGIDFEIPDFEKFIYNFRPYNDSLIISYERSINCNDSANSSINLNTAGGTLPYIYHWSNGSTTEDIVGLSPGEYSVSINDYYNQTKVISSIIIPSLINISKKIEHISENQNTGSINITISGGEEPYRYNWSNGETTKNISGLLPGFYSVTVTDNNLCSISSNAEILDKIIDGDGNIYQAVTIDDQVWFGENLKVTHYNNGEPILDGTGLGIYTGESEDYKYCFNYNDDQKNGDVYGKLYTWYTLDDSRGICPTGWQVPSKEDWEKMSGYLGKSGGGKLKETGTAHWQSPNLGASNETGFTALPSGHHYPPDGFLVPESEAFTLLGISSIFWTSSPDTGDSIRAWVGVMSNQNVEINIHDDVTKSLANSIRCIRDE